MYFDKVMEYHAPTKLVFGRGSLGRVPELLGEISVDPPRPLIVTDSGVVSAGICERLEKVLKEAKIDYFVFDKVVANPPSGLVDDAVNAYRSMGCNSLLAIGGGSSMDTAKGIGILATNGGSIMDYEGVGKVRLPLPPLGCIPTTYGTGSEVTPYVIVTDEERKFKAAIVSHLAIPSFAVLDPELCLRLPFHIAGAVGMDALTHAIESYTNARTNPITGSLALGAIRLISENLRQAAASDRDIEATSNMLLASCIAGLAFAMTRVGAVHAMAHPLGGIFNVPHGIANAVLLPYVMEFNLLACPDLFADIARAMGAETAGLSTLDAARISVEMVKELSEDLNIPSRLSELGVTEDRLDKMVEDSMASGTIQLNPRTIRKEDVKEIFIKAM